MAIRRHRSKEGFNMARYDEIGFMTYGRHVDKSKGKFARKVRRNRARRGA